MIRAANLVHKGLVDISSDMLLEENDLEDFKFGNKIALLSGDLLITKGLTKLLALKNHEVNPF